jgi:hypothetical protein
MKTFADAFLAWTEKCFTSKTILGEFVEDLHTEPIFVQDTKLIGDKNAELGSILLSQAMFMNWMNSHTLNYN